MLKYCMTILPQQFLKTLNQLFYLSRVNENLETCMPIWFECLNQSKYFGVLLSNNVLINRHYLEKAKYHVRWKLQHVSI